jgi:hypothetical protein
MRPKLIYFAERHPSFDRDGFRQRWRRHGRLGASLPRWKNVARYAQCDRIDGGLEGTEIDCDGVATVLFHSEATRLAHIADPDGAITKADEAETFARPVRSFSVLTEPNDVLQGESAAATKIFVAVCRRQGLAAERFAERWTSDMAHAMKKRSREEGVGYSYVQNLRRPDWAAGGVGIEADCIDEITTADPVTAWRVYRSTLADAASDLFRDIRFVLTSEAVLSDAL